MLSERERHELEIIERDLSSSDPRLSALLTRRLKRRMRRELVYSRSLVAFGVLVIVTAVLLSLDEAFVEGLVLASVGVCWWAWSGRPPASSSPRE
jgi:Protein of unknown function (DUF3040)